MEVRSAILHPERQQFSYIHLPHLIRAYNGREPPCSSRVHRVLPRGNRLAGGHIGRSGVLYSSWHGRAGPSVSKAASAAAPRDEPAGGPALRRAGKLPPMASASMPGATPAPARRPRRAYGGECPNGIGTIPWFIQAHRPRSRKASSPGARGREPRFSLALPEHRPTGRIRTKSIAQQPKDRI